jgi:antirestriction protein ArdC
MARRHSPTAAERQAREEARAEQLARLHQQLTAGVLELVNDESWHAMLTAAARFHTYSWRNCLLILAQMPTATRVAGYRAWQSLGRQVRKGEHGIAVIAPVTYRRSDEDAKATDAEDATSHEIRGWKIEHVFDISQTDGEPLADVEVCPIEGEAPEDLWDSLSAQLTAAGFALLRQTTPGRPDANGSMTRSEKTVRVREDLGPAQACKTLAHELAHIELGHGTATCTDTRSQAEVEAESVAYIVATSAGLDASAYSFPYIGHWAPAGKEADVMADTAERVLRTARRILAGLDAHDAA